MSVGFCPSRESMYKEIQQWIATNKLEMLMSLCNCCAYKALEYTGAYRCRSCHVRKGIAKLTHEDKRISVEKEDLQVVC